MNKNDYLQSFDPSLNGGTQRVYKFPNGYGASVIVGGTMAYGGHEIAVLKFTGDDEFHLCYDTPVTNDVIGHVRDESHEDEILAMIHNLE